MSRIKVGVIGVGNCASALVQGIEFYKNIDKEEECIGLRHLYVSEYHPRDIEFVCAFDVASGKVGKDLSEAIFAEPNNTLKFADVPKLDVNVLKGPVLDGISEYAKGIVKIDHSPEVDVAQSLKETGAEIVLNLLPSGAPKASFWYAEESLKAGCAFINATPTFIASDNSWAERYAEAGLPIVGDDLTDQVGATFLHKVLLETLNRRGVRISKTYQLDVGNGHWSFHLHDSRWLGFLPRPEVPLYDVDSLNQHPSFRGLNGFYLADLAAVSAFQDEYRVSFPDPQCHGYTTSGARETIFMNLFSLSSLATGPKTRVPLGSPWLSMITAALSSNLM